jgi:hypothetical protein
MARSLMTRALDTVIMGSSAVYTDVSLNEILGAPDAMAIHAVTDQVTGTSVTLTCAVESSGDNRFFVAKNSTPEIDAESLSTTATTSLMGYEPGTNPSSGYVRIRVQLGGTNPTARISLYVCGRTL